MAVVYLDKTASLIPHALAVITQKATEPPQPGNYLNTVKNGTFLCKRCGWALFRAHAQFSSSCGWPSFDEALKAKILCQIDADKKRTEILCARCDAHLGHVFYGEGLSPKNCRYCVNSLALDWVNHQEIDDSEEIILAAGCFWAPAYHFENLSGVLEAETGYCGGEMLYPSYSDVSTGKTGHFEAVRVIFDPKTIDLAMILKRFFEIHDPSQSMRQGPDIGPQYGSAIFYYAKIQFDVIMAKIDELKRLNINVATKILKANPFWRAEAIHQNYYHKLGKKPHDNH